MPYHFFVRLFIFSRSTNETPRTQKRTTGIGLEPVAPPSSSSTTSSKDKKQHDGVVVAAASSKDDDAVVNNNAQNHHRRKNENDDDDDSSDSFSSILEGAPPEISLQTQLDYARRGHAVLRSFLPERLVERLRSELVPYARSNALSGWRQKVEVQLADDADEDRRRNASSIASGLESVEECEAFLESLGISSGDMPFLQHFNAWRSPEACRTVPSVVRDLCLSPYLAQTASILLDSPTVRLYQDSLFHKRAGIDGWTPWHSDARMAPFDTSRMVSFWIPLQYVPSQEDGGTGLLFVDGSHSDMALPYWNGSDGDEYDRLEERYGGGGGGGGDDDDDDDDDDGNGGGVAHHMPLEVGSATVHAGWTLHCADPAAGDGSGDDDRYALSIVYVDGRAELREGVLSPPTTTTTTAPVDRDDKEDAWSFRSWVSEVEPRKRFRHPMVPIVWPPTERDDVR